MFEGYIGIRLWNGQLMEDIWFSIIFALFFLFAINTRIHSKSFVKMFQSLASKKNNLEMSMYYKRAFHFFMLFQTILLVSLGITQEAYHQEYLTNINKQEILISLGCTFVIIYAFYLIRRFIYFSLIYIFASSNFYRKWNIYYNALTSIWGIILYIPVTCMVFLENFHSEAIFIMILSYIIFRFAIIYKTIRLFHIKKFDLFYLSLYLCSHEILPLIILSKGFIYLYNFIEKSALWH